MNKKFTFLMASLMLLTIIGLPGKAVGQTRTTIISEDFSDITVGNSTGSSGSGTAWDGNDNFPTKSNAYKAGGAVRIGTGSNIGYITSKKFNAEEGTLTVALDIKGWGTSGSVQITFNGSSQTVSCSTSSWSAGFESKSVNFTLTGDVTDKTVKISSTSSSKRMFVDNVVVTNTPPASVATPTFVLASGRTGTDIITEDIVMLDCETTGATIYYTMGANPTDPTSSSTVYDANKGIEVNESTTIKAIAINGDESSFVATATYTVYTPLTSMQAIYENAEANIAEHTVAITFNNWVVSGVNGTSGTSNQNTAFLTDGTKGCVIYKNGGNLNFSKGNVLSGSAICKLQRYSSSADYYAEITELMSNTEGLTVNTGGSVTPVETTIDALSTVNVGSVVTIRNLYYNGSYLSDGTNKIVSFNTLGYSTYTNGKTYDVTGVFTQAYNSNSTKRILPSTSSDVVLKATITATDFSGLVPFTYVATQGGPSAVQSVTISGSDFSGDLTVTASDKYQVSSNNSTWGTTATYTQSSGTVSGTLYIRLAAGLSAGTHNGNLTCTATNLTTKEVALEGTVSTSALYTVSIASGIENGTIESDKNTAVEDETVTITVTPADCYELATLTYNDGTTTTNIDKTAKQFAMPASNVTVNATFTQKTYTISYSVNGTVEDDLEDEVTCGNTITLWNAAKLETEGIGVPAGFVFYGWSATEVDLTQIAPTLVASSYVPTADMTLYAVFATAEEDGYKYTLVGTDDIEQGTYLIGALLSTSASNVFRFATTTITDGSIGTNSSGTSIAEVNGKREITTLPTGAVEFVFTGNNTNGFTISADNTNFLGYTSYEKLKLAFDDDYSGVKWKVLAKTEPLLTNGTYLQNYDSENSRYYTVSENSTSTTTGIRGYASSTAYRALYLFKKGVNYNYSNYCSTVEILSGNVSGTKTGACTVASAGATVKTNTTLTVTGTLINTDATKLIIEDGGQLIIPTGSTVAATFKKNMPATKNGKDDIVVTGWELISSPTNNGTDDGGSYENFASVTHLTDASYVLFKYDEKKRQWINSNHEGDVFTKLYVGQGYLYGNTTGKTVEFTGNVNSAESYTCSLTYNVKEGDNLAGFNLIGNPYSHELVWSTNVDRTTNVSNGYYKIVDDAFETTLYKTPIAPMQGILVQAQAASQSVTFYNEEISGDKGEKANADNIMFKVENSEYSDVAYALFDKGYGLNKISHRGENVPMLYIPQDGTNYAIAMMDDNTNSFNLNFEAKTTGRYTLSYKLDGEFNYLHVIDRATGEDIDMLLEGSYSFIGSPMDNAQRFIVRLGYLPNYEDNGEDIFAYQSGNDIIVSGEGELQIFDVMGRKVSTMNIYGVETISGIAQGVYIFRMEGKTQKIVVR